MDSDDPDILAFGSMPPPEPGRRFGPGPLGWRAPRLALAGLAVAGLTVACVALTSGGAAQAGRSPAAHSVPAVTIKYQAGVSGFLRAELPAVRLSTGQTVPLRTIATTHCHHQ